MDLGALGVYACLFMGLYFEVFLLISFFEKRPSQKTAHGPRRFPAVSIIVPCYNEERTIAATVQSLLALEYQKKKLNIVVVDEKVYRPRNLLEHMQAVEYIFGVFFKKMFDNLASISVLPGPFSLYRREVFQKVGTFRHAHNTEDMEMAFRMHAHGLKIANAHTAYVHTTVPKTLRTLLTQRVRWSQGYLQNSLDYRYMYGNLRFGHFGMFTLPFGLAAFAAGLYLAGYMLYHVATTLGARTLTLWATGIPLRPPALPTEWFFLNTSMMLFLTVAVFLMTLAAIILGARIAQARLSAKSLAIYFVLFGFVAPLWLLRAVWNTARVRESVWR
ncbi:glycosyltransferase family 2 protein [Patescibacteria group bacterium]|nr:glycosyltransferase family 2 protein [Patescibacteria group bacterium]